MPVDLAVWPADVAATPIDLENSTPVVDDAVADAAVRSRFRERAERVVIVRRADRHPLLALLEAEHRGAPDHEVRLLEEAAIAASIARVRAAMRDGVAVTATDRARFDRDRELLRRFPEDRRGAHGEGWFHLG